MILNGEINDGDSVAVTAGKSGLTFTVTAAKTKPDSGAKVA